MIRAVVVFLFVSFFISCSQTDKPLFKILPSSRTGIDFNNLIIEDDSVNILEMEYLYNGGAVAVADFNNDDLQDILFTGNQVPDRLYLNKGNLSFKDVSEEAGITKFKDKWRSGAAIVDINNDGLQDIYICATISSDSSARANVMLVNQGIAPGGYPFFKDMALEYGIADTGHSSNAAFFDYDNDGDLDLYVLTNVIEKGIPTTYRPKINDGSAANTDRLYRNNGDGTFTNVSREAGIIHEGYGLGLAIADINQDGWRDIYVSNDYISNDLLYINNKNGTFTNLIDEHIKHQSQFSMGNDIADYNNDALPDIITLDMLPAENLRRKTVINGVGYVSYINNAEYGYAPQYIRNMLQLNNGNGSFSEVGHLAGVYDTEWSWSPLFADVDNDGFRDLLITNGFPKDITDKDFGSFRSGPAGAVASTKFLLDSIPVVKVANYGFKNNGDLTFSDATTMWGMNRPSFSNGAAFADLDNDGDLDYVVNNINDKAFLYENTLYTAGSKDAEQNNYLRLELRGPRQNRAGLGTRVWLRYGRGQLQYHDHSIYRGYLGVVEGMIHFGLEKTDVVDSVIVKWPDGKMQLILNVKADQVVTVDYDSPGSDDVGFQEILVSKHSTLLKDVTGETGISFLHEEQDKIDFNIQRTLPHKFSQEGPSLAVGDVDGDGLEDFFVGGSAGVSGGIFLQQQNGNFVRSKQFTQSGKMEEDAGALLFDADNDGDLDLLISSGSFEYPPDSPFYQDRLYRNDGAGNFAHDSTALPDIRISSSCVRAADFDQDGDLDLFLGGRVIPGKYPYPASSHILRNEGGKFFLDATEAVCPALKTAGLVTDALWTDFDNDERVDLMIAGEFMPLSLFHNEGGRLSRMETSGLDKFSGWWNSIVGADFDKDGDVDYIAGNLGLNNYYNISKEYPLKVFAKDFDGNNSVDPILACYLKSGKNGDKELYPVHFWDELNSQSPKFRRKFSRYRQYGSTTMDKFLTNEEKEEMLVLLTNHSSTSYIENLGQGTFNVRPLPLLAQVAPVNGIIADDFNNDGNLDAMMVGNNYGNEVFAGRYDAFTGLILLGDGEGGFDTLPSKESGFFVDGDAKALAKVSCPKRDIYVATQNRDSLKVFAKIDSPLNKIKIKSLDSWAELVYSNGRREKIEFYYGSGYLSQSSRDLSVPKGVKSVVIYSFDGSERHQSLND